MYSVKFNVKNGRKYYLASDAKYHLEDEDMMLDKIPAPLDDSKMHYYYYDGNEWMFDNDAYEAAKEQEIVLPGVQETVTLEEILNGLVELAENISDLEDALVELAGMEG